MGFTALQLCPTPDGLIPWQTIEHAIAKADDLATLSRIKNALDAFKILARQKADAIQTHNTIMKYLDDIDEKRWVLKHEAGIKRGGPKTRPVSLAEINMTKRDSRAIEIKAKIDKSVRIKYIDDCNAKGEMATETGIQRLAYRQAPKIARRWPDGKYGLIYADPPWKHEYQHGYYSPPANHYDLMSDDEIAALLVADVAAPDCTLLLWCPACMTERAIAVAKRWGFHFRTEWVWYKMDRKNPGHYGCSDFEVVIIAGRGKSTPTAEWDRIYSVSSVQTFPRRGLRHSEKPKEYYGIIEKLWPDARKLELFARNARHDWEGWGDEVPDEAA
jgi:N6-adenosine-specific RNA methylase IME4